MQTRFTLPIVSALVAAFSLASCQRQGEWTASPSEGIAFTVASSSQTKSSAAEASPVSIPVKSDGGEEFTLEVSSRPWTVEGPSAPATKVTPSGASYFSSSHNSFGVMTYRASSEGAAAASRTLSWTDEAVFNGGIWAPSTFRAWPFEGNYLTFFGWAPIAAVTPSNNSGVPVISNFTVNANTANQVDLLVFGMESTDSPLVSGICVPVTFDHALTAVKFVEEYLTINSVSISGIYDKGSYNMETGAWSGQSSLSKTYSLTSEVTEESSTLMLLPQTLPAGATLTAVTSAGTITASLAGQVWEAGKEVTYRLTGPKPKSFTVSSSGAKVRFSSGNLQGNAPTWEFAPNQWSYAGYYAATTNFSALGSGWRMPTFYEWDYLLSTRTGDRYCKAKVNDVNGLVIFPDDYAHPYGVTAPASVNTGGAAYASNSWAGAEWAAMEVAGCVFLPAAGALNYPGGPVMNGGWMGYYWSSTPYNGYMFLFFDNEKVSNGHDEAYFPQSVRLVQDL